MISGIALVTIVGVLFTTLWVSNRRRWKVRPPYPPGPRAEPILGHLRAVPSSYDEGAYREMGDKYGEIVYLNVLGKSIVLLNSERVAIDLLDKRGVIYSDRPPLPFFDMIGWGDVLSFLRYGNEFFKVRKLFQDQLARKKCDLFHGIQLSQRCILLRNLFDSPDRFTSHAKRYVTAVVLEISYGRKVVFDDDRFLKNAEILDELIAAVGATGLNILDFLPILKYIPPWVPGAWFSKFAHRARPLIRAIKDYGLEVVQQDMSSGKAQKSFSSLHLEELSRQNGATKEDLERLKVAAFQMYSAGGETTWSAMETFFLAMVLHPNAQKRAQRELDTVVGHGQLPEFEDQDNLPYLRCVVHEVLRWYPVVPLGLPHRVMQDDIYEGMFIPEGASVVANLRICPGRWLAESEMWIAFASILSMFDIKPIQDDQGNDVLPKAEFHDSLTSFDPGDVVGLKALRKSIIVLNNEKSASDLLEKRSAIYSDRPRFPMLELMGWTTGALVFLPYNKYFHDTRKVFQKQLSRQASAIFQENQSRQALVLMQNLLNTPENLEAHLQRYSASVVAEIAYGHHITSADDPYLEMVTTMNVLLAGVGGQGSNPVDLFPALQKLPSWFPGAWFIRYAEKNLPIYTRMRNYGFDEVRKQMALGTAKPSFLSLNLEDLLREGKENETELHRMKASAFSIISAGSETTKATIHILILSLLLHPQAQRKAQEEIDRVIGSGRLPDFSDRDSLPFVECLMYESLRWHPPAPLGVPHRVMEDDVYRGMFIPRGSTVVANIQSMTLDGNVYRDPTIFFPERYLPQPEGFGEPQPQVIFGFGRRICPGRFLAESSVWIVLATLLTVFDIRPAKDEQGSDIIPPEEFNTGLTRYSEYLCDPEPLDF
ncbi:hypothetical protein NLI96_g4625 [Meripilus lineatus]|uniref:Cytochrome P450 n=1 Tax=Meripilus lineatus TaxID=2056292 RepID=A0AAD5V4V3_9APHY|nr:hypothetical protein NLI96_g4625 [Physisporinus lineatus]